MAKFISSHGPLHTDLNIKFLLSIYSTIVLDYICGTSFMSSEMSSELDLFIKAFIQVHDISLEGHVVDVFPIFKYLAVFFPSLRKLNNAYDYVRWVHLFDVMVD